MAHTCPSCEGVMLVAQHGEARCPACAGRFLDDSQARYLLGEADAERDFLENLAAQFAGTFGACPECNHPLRKLQLRGAWVGPCFGCGGLWLPHGALAPLSRGAREDDQRPRRALVPATKPGSVAKVVEGLGWLNVVAVLVALPLIRLGSGLPAVIAGFLLLFNMLAGLPSGILFMTSLVTRLFGPMSEARWRRFRATLPWLAGSLMTWLEILRQIP